jgi:hypothetical protein
MAAPGRWPAGFRGREDGNEYVNALVIREMRRRVSVIYIAAELALGSAASGLLRLHLRN